MVYTLYMSEQYPIYESSETPAVTEISSFIQSQEGNNLMLDTSDSLCDRVETYIRDESVLLDKTYDAEEDPFVTATYLDSVKDYTRALATAEGLSSETAAIVSAVADKVEGIESTAEAFENLVFDSSEQESVFKSIVSSQFYSVDSERGSGVMMSEDISYNITNASREVQFRWERIRTREEHLLSQNDEVLLAESAPALLNLLKEAQEKGKPYKSLVYLTRGGRLFEPLVRGMMDADGSIEKPQARFVAVSKDAKRREDNQLSKRVQEVTDSCEPPYLLIDDYVTSEHATHDKMMAKFQEAGVAGEDCDFFAFLGATRTRDEEVLSDDFYDNLGIKVGRPDREYGLGLGFEFVTDESHFGTEKVRLENKVFVRPKKARYERRVPERDGKAVTNIRRSLYAKGQEIGEQEQVSDQ
jgi:hypothetical protein